jgi:hypothetical protein
MDWRRVLCACALLATCTHQVTLAADPREPATQTFEVFYVGWSEGSLTFQIPTDTHQAVRLEFVAPDRKRLTMLRLTGSGGDVELTSFVSEFPVAFPTRASLVFHKWDNKDPSTRSLSIIIPFQKTKGGACKAAWFLVTGTRVEQRKTIDVPDDRCSY